MTEDTKKTEETTEVKTEQAPVEAKSETPKSEDAKPARRKNIRKNNRKPRRPQRQKSEFDQKIMGIRRVTRVVKGGRRFSFSVAAVIGDRKGRVGVGVGKAGDTALAIDKAIRQAKKNMVTIPLEDGMIARPVRAKYNASIVELRPAPGRGIVVGSSVRDVIELAGIKDVSGKLLSRSKNTINNARATVKALASLS